MATSSAVRIGLLSLNDSPSSGNGFPPVQVLAVRSRFSGRKDTMNRTQATGFLLMFAVVVAGCDLPYTPCADPPFERPGAAVSLQRLAEPVE